MSKMKRIYLLPIILILLGIGVFSVLTRSPKQLSETKPVVQEQKLKKISLRLKWIDQAQFAGFYMASANGYYKNSGLDVTINPAGPDISSIQMVVNGADMFGITSGDQILLAREKGLPVVAVATIYRESPVGFASLKKENITSPRDLIGKTVAMVYGKDEEAIYKALLAKEGIKRQDIKEVPKVMDISQLTSGKVDVQVVYENNEPILMQQKGFDVNILRPRDYGINFYADTIFTTEDNIRNNPEVVKKFVQNSIQGWKSTIDNQDQAVNEVLKRNGKLDKDHQRKFLELSVPLILEQDKIGFSTKEGWESMQKIMLDQGVLKSPQNIDKLFTNSFLN